MAEYETILLTIDGPVAVITLNRPERLNAWTWQMDTELRHAFCALDAQDDVRAIVVTGAGRAFLRRCGPGGRRLNLRRR